MDGWIAVPLQQVLFAMCGIVGLYLCGETVRRQQIDAMNAAITHRGPDEEGVFVDESVGLGMRRLSIIDLKGGRQPISNESGLIHVIQNGEIYNFHELRQELERLGHCFKTHSDTEAIVHSYEEWGGFDFAGHLRGMFAIAIWDACRQELWLARDRIGIKPLYYSVNSAGLAFGSEVKSLLASPIVRRELEPRVLAQYFTFGHAGIEDSFIKDVHQLRPGQILRYDGQRSESRKYWELHCSEKRCRMDEQEAIEVLREHLRESVRMHLVSDVPVGAFLSGGVDSSAIVGMMAQEGCTNLRTFSIGFDEETHNELPYAQKVSARWHTEHHTEVIRPEAALSILDQLVDHFDEPFADASAIPMWFVSRAASQEVKVVLTGDGGDELFAGYSRYTTLFRDAWLDRIPPAVRRFGSGISRRLNCTFPGGYFLHYAAGDQESRYVDNLALMPSLLRQRLIRPEWQPERLGVCDPTEDSLQLMQQSGSTDLLAKCMYLDTLRYLPCDILVKVDRMTMAHGLEARPPLLDHKLIELVASLPTALKYKQYGRQKQLFKEAVAQIVSTDILNRKKKGFSVPLRSWFSGPLASLLIDSVLTNGQCREYLDTSVIRLLFDENRRGRRDHGLKLWAILMFELWLRRVLHSE